MDDRVALSKFVCEQNIERYERMLQTPLTDVERDFIQRRIAEERKVLRDMQSGIGNAATNIASRIIGVALISDLADYLMSSGFDLTAQVGLI